MSKWLFDPSTGRQVRVAPGREARPNDVGGPGAAEGATPDGGCPFCAPPGVTTPPESDRIEGEDGAWLVRTVPNRYPAFDGDDGVCEVVIESPEHVTRFVDLPLDHAAAAVTQWARRVRHWSEDPRFDYQIVFKNEGIHAGASLRHAHSQVIALSDTPAGVESLWRDSADWREGIGDRLVVERDEWIVFAPVAPRFDGETWIAPKAAGTGFTRFAEDHEAARVLAELIQGLLRGLSAIGADSFNLMLQQPGRGTTRKIGNDWRIELTPRMAVLAGFELATGAFVNTLAPAESAAKLRNALMGPTGCFKL